MRRILITGGPVHAHIDDVKIVTNRFKGGLMAALATELAIHDCKITYLTAPGAVEPGPHENITVLKHKGYFDYKDQVLDLAQTSTDVILGAAVANLIPAEPIKGKFPSHNYNEGDIVSLNFVVTPRVITKVKGVAPKVNLIGFKLLSGASHQELLDAAWHTLIDSKAVAVVANDATDLNTKYVQTKEGAVHEMPNKQLADFLWDIMCEEHYATSVVNSTQPLPYEIEVPLQEPSLIDTTPHLGSMTHDLKKQPTLTSGKEHLEKLLTSYRQEQPHLFVKTIDGMVFGTAALRNEVNDHGLFGFWTTGRGKRELDEIVYVRNVDHASKTVYVSSGKASLNAPLLSMIFESLPLAHAIIHGHIQDPDIPSLPYAQPGTVRDTQRRIRGSFNIINHGCFYILDREGQRIDWKE